MNHLKVTNAPTMGERVKALGGKAVAAAATFIGSAGLAIAQTASEAETIIETQKGIALAVVLAGTVAILAIRYTKLARRA